MGRLVVSPATPPSRSLPKQPGRLCILTQGEVKKKQGIIRVIGRWSARRDGVQELTVSCRWIEGRWRKGGVGEEGGRN